MGGNERTQLATERCQQMFAGWMLMARHIHHCVFTAEETIVLPCLKAGYKVPYVISE